MECPRGWRGPDHHRRPGESDEIDGRGGEKLDFCVAGRWAKGPTKGAFPQTHSLFLRMIFQSLEFVMKRAAAFRVYPLCVLG